MAPNSNRGVRYGPGVAAPGAPGLAELGITPTAVEVILPTYMDRFRRGGWFSAHGMKKPNE